MNETALLLLLFSCSHPDKNLIKKAHVPGSCSDRIKHITVPSGQKVIDLSKQMTAGSASILIAGVGAATDGLVIMLTHPVTKTTLCVGAIAALATKEVNLDGDICAFMFEPHYNPKLAQKALDTTRDWRCPNLDYISEGLRDVAHCYAEKNEMDKSKLQFENILKNKTISRCISQAEKDNIKNDLQSVRHSGPTL